MRGFTLLELVVVIVILLGLAALILPNLDHRHESARRAACANNLSQIGKALIMYSDVPAYGTFPTNKPKGRGDPLPSLGILYADYISDARAFSCADKPTIAALKALGATTATTPSATPLSAAMTHYGYDPGNQSTNFEPHSPNDAMAIVVADFTAAGRNSDNHGPSAGQVCLRASGSVEWFDKLENFVATSPRNARDEPIGNNVVDDDITADGVIRDRNCVRMKSFISQ